MLLCVAAAMLLLCSSVSSAQETHAWLEEARLRMQELELEHAIEILVRADRSDEVAAGPRIQALLLLAECQVTLEQLDGARASARRIYEMDPEFAAQGDAGIPRRVLRLLEAARAERPASVEVLFEPPLFARDTATDRSVLEVAIVQGREAVDRVVFEVGTRQGTQTLVAERAADRWRAALDPSAVLNRTIRVRAVAHAPSGAVLGELGPVALSTPLVAPVLAPSHPPTTHRAAAPDVGAPATATDRAEPGSILGSPWFWIGVGAVAASVTAGLLLVGDGGCDESLEPWGTICLK